MNGEWGRCCRFAGLPAYVLYALRCDFTLVHDLHSRGHTVGRHLGYHLLGAWNIRGEGGRDKERSRMRTLTSFSTAPLLRALYPAPTHLHESPQPCAKLPDESSRYSATGLGVRATEYMRPLERREAEHRGETLGTYPYRIAMYLKVVSTSRA